jgi:uncharacterized protein YjiS (DUF1127 family)
MPRQKKTPLTEAEKEHLRRNPPEVLSLSEAAIFLGYSEKTVKRLIDTGHLRKLPPRIIRIPLKSIRAFLDIPAGVIKKYLLVRRKPRLAAQLDAFWPLEVWPTKTRKSSVEQKKTWLRLRLACAALAKMTSHQIADLYAE